MTQITRVLLFLGAAAAAGACAPTTRVYTESETPDLPHAIVVMGTGDASASPDVARISLGVEATNVNAQTAVDEANSKMHAVIETLKKNGVADKDIRTAQFDIHSEEPPPPPPVYETMPVAPSPAPVGKPSAPVSPPAPRLETSAPRPPVFRVSNTVLLTFRHLDKVGDILTAAVNAGANHAWGIQFDIDDPKPLLAEARNEAVADARRRAEELARLSGVRLGRILHISESEGREGPPMPMAAQSYRVQEAVPVERGELTIMHNVRIAYAIAE